MNNTMKYYVGDEVNAWSIESDGQKSDWVDNNWYNFIIVKNQSISMNVAPFPAIGAAFLLAVFVSMSLQVSPCS